MQCELCNQNLKLPAIEQKVPAAICGDCLARLGLQDAFDQLMVEVLQLESAVTGNQPSKLSITFGE